MYMLHTSHACTCYTRHMHAHAQSHTSHACTCSSHTCHMHAHAQSHMSHACGRYKVVVEVPVQKALFRMLPSSLQRGKEIVVFVVLFSQGINEQQSIADK